MSLGNRLFAFRERFRKLDRKWHVLIGSQLLFGLLVVRTYNSKESMGGDNKALSNSDNSKPNQ